MATTDSGKNKMLAAALHYAKSGSAVIPVHGITEAGRCTCGKPYCNDAGKHPIPQCTPNGIKDASTDEGTITRWFTQFPQANLAIALGKISGIVVIDVDGPKGQATLDRLLTKYEFVLPPKYIVETGREDGGRHHYFAYPKTGNVGTKKYEGLEVRSNGTYVVMPPSKHRSGKKYFWRTAKTDRVLDALPQCFIDFARLGAKVFQDNPASVGRPPKIAAAKRSLAERLSAGPKYSPPMWSPAEEERLISAMIAIPFEKQRDRTVWLSVGMALHWTTWERGRQLWDAWSRRFGDQIPHNDAEQEKAWNSFGRADYTGPATTLASVYAMAAEAGWKAPQPEIKEPEEPPQVKDSIEQINQRHFVIRNIGGKCLVGEMIPNPSGSGYMLSLQSPDAFKTWYSNQYISVRDADGNVKKKQLGAYWLQHKRRRGHEGVDLIPNAPPELPNGTLNLWRGFGVEAKQGAWPLMLRHVCEVLAAGDRKAAEYILRWAAWAMQNPDKRAEVALVFQGGKGCGKGVFVRALARCFGEHGVHITNQEHLVGKFNSHLRSCLLLFADEAFWAGNKKSESVLKGLITEPTLMIEQKGIDPIQWPNRLKIIMAANADWVVPASADERRYAVNKCSDALVRGNSSDEVRDAYFKALHDELETGGREAMLYAMQHWNLGGWHPRQVYETEGLRQQKEESLSLIEQWFVEMLQEGRLPRSGWSGSKKDYSSSRALAEDAKQRVPRLNGRLSDKALGDFLRKRGCIHDKEYKPVETRGWRFPPLAQMRGDWTKKYGRWEWRDPAQDNWE